MLVPLIIIFIMLATTPNTAEARITDCAYGCSMNITRFCVPPQVPVCAYPGGDDVVRTMISQLPAKLDEPECLQIMKKFLCLLLSRPCEGTKARQICYTTCWNAYSRCGYDPREIQVKCQHFVQLTPWLADEGDSVCVNMGARAAASSAWIIMVVVVVVMMMLV